MNLEHIAFIMDGNRRYGKTLEFDKKRAYKLGLDKMFDIIKLQIKYELKETSFFALSSDNYKKRTVSELKILFELVKDFAKSKELRELVLGNNIKINLIGNIDSINRKTRPDMELNDEKAIEKLKLELENLTKQIKSDPKYIVNVFINYDGQEEIVNSVKKIISKNYSVNEINQDLIKENLYYKQDPPQIIVRTGDAPRLSGFMLWHSKYSEIYLTKKMWPELTENDFIDILDWYKNIKRNFGV